MARVLSDFPDSAPSTTPAAGALPASEGSSKGDLLPGSALVLDRPQMPRGWMNSEVGIAWMTRRSELIAGLSARWWKLAQTKTDKRRKSNIPTED